jgi:hypothetical protein
VIRNVNEGEEDAQVVFALKVADARVYIFGMETVIFEAANDNIRPWATNGYNP